MLHRIVKGLAGLLILSSLVGPAVAARLGSEFPISAKGLNSSVAPLPAGGFVVVWRDDSPSYGVSGQRFNGNGAKIGGVFTVVTSSPEKTNPSVAALPGGAFVVTWDANDASGLGAYGQRFTSNAVKAGNRFRANTFTTGDQSGAVVAGLTGGTFVVMWSSDNQDGSDSAVYAQRYNHVGTKLGVEFRVDTTLPTSFHQFPSVAPLADGGFVAVWRGFNGTYGQRFDAGGGQVGDEFQVNTTTEGLLQHPVVAGVKNGGFVVVREVSTDNLDVFARRYNKNGVAVGESFRVNAVQADYQFNPAITPLSNGGFAVVWSEGASNHACNARLYRPTGPAIGGNIKVNTSVVPVEAIPSVGPLANGGFIAAWQGGSQNGVRGQRFNGK